jgi:hypothetical protein
VSEPHHDALPSFGDDDPVSPELAVYVWAIVALGVGYFLYKRYRSSAASSATPTTGPTANPAVVVVRDRAGQRSRSDSARAGGRRAEAGQHRVQAGPKPFPVPAAAAGSPLEPPATIRPERKWRGGRVGIAIFGALLVVVGGAAALRYSLSRTTPVPTVAAPAAPTSPTSTRTSKAAAARPAARTFAWAPASGAAAYHVEIRRGNRIVYSTRTRATRISVRLRTAGAKAAPLRPGTYRWYVWPLLGHARRRGAAVVATTFVVER